MKQRTIRRAVETRGIGLHTGESVRIALKPADPDTGVRFVRSDLCARPDIPACLECVKKTTLATTLAENGTQVSTVEHIMAAIAGIGIDNLLVEVDGPEVPIMDGSAAPFVDLLNQAGTRVHSKPKLFLFVEKPLSVEAGDRFICIRPAESLDIHCTIRFDHPLLQHQERTFTLSRADFERQIGPARTFGFLKDVQMLWRNGLARGGSLENAVVLDDLEILNPEGLRFPDECVRHKILDFIGDIALFGLPILGQCTVHKSGHDLNLALLRTLCDHPDHWRIGPLEKPHLRSSGTRFPMVRERRVSSGAVPTSEFLPT